MITSLYYSLYLTALEPLHIPRVYQLNGNPVSQQNGIQSRKFIAYICNFHRFFVLYRSLYRVIVSQHLLTVASHLKGKKGSNAYGSGRGMKDSTTVQEQD